MNVAWLYFSKRWFYFFKILHRNNSVILPLPPFASAHYCFYFPSSVLLVSDFTYSSQQLLAISVLTAGLWLWRSYFWPAFRTGPSVCSLSQQQLLSDSYFRAAGVLWPVHQYNFSKGRKGKCCAIILFFLISPLGEINLGERIGRCNGKGQHRLLCFWEEGGLYRQLDWAQ